MATFKLMSVWLILFIVAIDLYTRRPNGSEVLLDAYDEMISSSWWLQIISIIYWYIAIPLTIPKSLYIILIKTNKDDR